MMHHMGGPEKSIFMTDSVKPVVAKIVSKENQYPDPPDKGYCKNPEVQISKGQYCQYHGFGDQSNKYISQAHRNRSSSIFKRIGSHMLLARYNDLKD